MHIVVPKIHLQELMRRRDRPEGIRNRQENAHHPRPYVKVLDSRDNIIFSKEKYWDAWLQFADRGFGLKTNLPPNKDVLETLLAPVEEVDALPDDLS